jgi:predicted RNase H-like HicB family nuclease
MTAKAKYAIVIEPGDGSFGAYVPDLPGCTAVGESVEEVQALIGEAIQLHLESLAKNGEPVPPPKTVVAYAGSE